MYRFSTIKGTLVLGTNFIFSDYHAKYGGMVLIVLFGGGAGYQNNSVSGVYFDSEQETSYYSDWGGSRLSKN